MSFDSEGHTVFETLLYVFGALCENDELIYIFFSWVFDKGSASYFLKLIKLKSKDLA